jgi:hypothetical protein
MGSLTGNPVPLLPLIPKLLYLQLNGPLFYHTALLLVLLVTGVFAFGQSKSEPNSTTGYTVTKRLLSIEDGLAGHRIAFTGARWPLSKKP